MQANENKQHEPLTENDHTEHQSLNTTTDEIYQEMDGLGEFFMEQMDAIVEEFDQYRADTDAALADLGVTGHNARLVYGTYTGTGKYGATHPNRLNLGFAPVLVMISDGNIQDAAWPTVMFRPAPKGKSCASGNGSALTVTWGDTYVSWYGTINESYQFNGPYTYYYLALGYDA